MELDVKVPLSGGRGRGRCVTHHHTPRKSRRLFMSRSGRKGIDQSSKKLKTGGVRVVHPHPQVVRPSPHTGHPRRRQRKDNRTGGFIQSIPATHDGVRFAAAAQGLPRVGLAPGVEAPRHHSCENRRKAGMEGSSSCHVHVMFGL